MGTPLKSLPIFLSSKLLSPRSPLSPKLLSVPKRGQQIVSSLEKPEENTQRVLCAAKKLEFSQYSSPKQLVDHIRVKVTDYTGKDKKIVKSDFFINTPNKKEIFENGIKDIKGHTVLGTGSFGKVVKGMYKGQIVAVKVVKNVATLKEKYALHLNHDNIVKTLDIIQNQKGNFSLIIMEFFLHSRQLQALLNSREEEINVINFAIDISKGLEFLHGKGILHLDIKPQNIIVVDSTCCKICDFGNSTNINATEDFSHQGTIIYTAPELLQGRLPTDKCDVYSLGILLWQLKSKIAPYRDVDNVETVIYKVVKCNFRPENGVPKDEYSELYQVCWNMDPYKRPSISNVLPKLKRMY